MGVLACSSTWQTLMQSQTRKIHDWEHFNTSRWGSVNCCSSSHSLLSLCQCLILFPNIPQSLRPPAKHSRGPESNSPKEVAGNEETWPWHQTQTRSWSSVVFEMLNCQDKRSYQLSYSTPWRTIIHTTITHGSIIMKREISLLHAVTSWNVLNVYLQLFYS